MSRCASARLRILPSSSPLIQNLQAKNRRLVAFNSNWESSSVRRIKMVAASLQTLTIRVKGDSQRLMRQSKLSSARTNSTSASPRQLPSQTEIIPWWGIKCTLERTLDLRIITQTLCWVERNALVQHLVGSSQRSSQKCLASGWAHLKRELFKRSYWVSRHSQASTTLSSILVNKSSMKKIRHAESSILFILTATKTKKMSSQIAIMASILRKRNLARFPLPTSNAWKRS